MKRKLHLKFDPNQKYQLTAIDSVIQLFDGLSKYQGDFTKDFLSDEIVPNLPPDESIYEDFLLENLNYIQRQNKIGETLSLSDNEGVYDGPIIEGAHGEPDERSPKFTIEMETGTGKTYVYLRTIYELRKQYGFSKFIIIVPSIAIYEGVKKSFEITKNHFASLYSNEVVNLFPYDGTRLSKVRSFATSTFTEIMVITIQAFNKVRGNNIYKHSEKLPGELQAYQYIQKTRPILILDEPQSIDNTEKAKKAIRTLNPLFTLRYSATHRIKPNLLYRLTPVDAYHQNLVKKIQVFGVTEEENLNRPALVLESVTKSPITAKVKTLVAEKGAVKEEVITLKQGDNLHDKTKRDEHKDGYLVAEIGVAKKNEFVQFENTLTIRLNENLAPSRPEIFRIQIRETIKQHMEMQQKLYDKGIKILSLFFIDRVANYTKDDGIIRTIFDQEFELLKPKYSHFQKYSPEIVREGYFSTNKSGDAIDTEGRTVAQREAEKKAFTLIMQKKEQLLSFDEPVSFIFAHSALKEGWDNPNVFQICTLNQTASEIKKRQEIGRGLRLCVDQDGNRIFDEDINILTVVANESYEEYAAGLQHEYVKDGEEAPPKPKRPQQSKVERRDELFNSDAFQSFWEKLGQRTKYNISIDSNKLIKQCIEQLNNNDFPEPKIVLSKGRFIITEYSIQLKSVNKNKATICLQTRSTERENTLFSMNKEGEFKVRDDLSRKFDEPRLRGYKILEIIEDGENSLVKFSDKNQTELHIHQPIEFSSEKGQTPDQETVETLKDNYPVFNLIERAAKETKLTRATLNRIFQGMSEDKKRLIFKNPEGFTSTFITTIRNIATPHIVDNIQFTLDNISNLTQKVEELFPRQKSLAQKELIEAGERGLYNQVQVDSEVETNFVNRRLIPDEEKVVLYFKFPSSFKVNFPKIIGNYNPDWGIIRQDENGKHTLELIRETKGRTDTENLRFIHEKLKIDCAKRHFKAIGVDYRVIDDKTPDWWVSKFEKNTIDTFSE